MDATDAKGEPIHQTLMAKKMQRLDESPDFRPFKFRIQAFTNAFLEEVRTQCWLPSFYLDHKWSISINLIILVVGPTRLPGRKDPDEEGMSSLAMFLPCLARLRRDPVCLRWSPFY